MNSFDKRITKRRTTGNLRPKTAAARLRPFVFFMGTLAMVLPAAALQVQPTYQVFEAKAGTSFNAQLTLTNNEEETLELNPTVKEWFQLEANKKFPAEDWLKVDRKPIVIAPGESRTVKFRMNVPKKATGELVGGLSFTTNPKAGSIAMQLTVVMYVGIDGKKKMAHGIDAVAVRISSNTHVGVLVSNSGNVHLRPTGWVYFEDAKGTRVLNAQILPGNPVFPGTQRPISTEIKGFKLPPGQYTAVIELKDVDRSLHEYPVIKKKITVLPQGTAEAR